MSKSSSRTTLRYKLLLLILSPAALGYIIYRACKDGGWKYFTQRLGLNYPRMTNNPPILIHCASVGEFNAAKPLILAIRKQYPEDNIIVSTNTPTAAQLVKQQNIPHVYLPLDYAFIVGSFLKKIDPKCLLVLETEIWPTLFTLAKNKNIPTAIVNGRLSKKSTRNNNPIKKDIATALNNLSILLTRSDKDRNMYIDIGANAETTHTIGNLKYAIKLQNTDDLPCTTIKRPFVLAVSTHDDEEMQITQHIEILKKKNILLVLAPRYPERGRPLLRQLENKNIKTSLRSTKEINTNDCDAYIVDTLGELDMYFNEAALVFVGGSLIPRGGHNMLEPASFGKCVIVGPHTNNFALETKELLNAKGIIQIRDSHDLGVMLIHLLNNDLERTQYGINARKFIKHKSTVLKDYLNFLEPILNRRIN